MTTTLEYQILGSNLGLVQGTLAPPVACKVNFTPIKERLVNVKSAQTKYYIMPAVYFEPLLILSLEKIVKFQRYKG